MSDPDRRIAEVNAFANRVADYVMTNSAIVGWSKRRVAVEAVTVVMEDAWHEVEMIGAPDA